MFTIEDFKIAYTNNRPNELSEWKYVDSLDCIEWETVNCIILSKGSYYSLFHNLISIKLYGLRSKEQNYRVEINYDRNDCLYIQKKFSKRLSNMEFIERALEYINCTFDEDVFQFVRSQKLISDCYRVNRSRPEYILANEESNPSAQRKVLSVIIDNMENDYPNFKVDPSLKQTIAKQAFLNPDKLFKVDTDAFLYDKTLKVSV